MRKSEVVMQKLNQAESLLERVATLVDQAIQMDENGDGVTAGRFFSTFNELFDMVQELGYEIAMPMQVEEDERDEEIERLEARLAQLKSQQ